MADLALRLGERLDLPARGAVAKSMQNRPQKEMENSYHQADNVGGAFSVEEDLEGHVLLVDDTVDQNGRSP